MNGNDLTEEEFMDDKEWKRNNDGDWIRALSPHNSGYVKLQQEGVNRYDVWLHWGGEDLPKPVGSFPTRQEAKRSAWAGVCERLRSEQDRNKG